MPLSDARRSLLDAVYTTFAPQAAPRRGGQLMAESLEGLSPGRLARLRRFLSLLRSPLAGLLTIGRPQAFERLAHRDRERVLRAFGDSGLADLRSGFQALKRLSLFLAYAAVDDDAVPRNRLWDAMGYPGPRNDAGPVPEPIAPVQHDLPARVDAIVVGSGAGGGVAASVLAAAGMRVLVLEAGPWPYATMAQQRELNAFSTLYLESGLCASDDLSFAILAGACVGGGTTVNWTTSLRMSDVVAAQWSTSSGGIDFGAGLAPHYDAVAARMGITPTDTHNENNRVIARGCDALGWSWKAHPRNARDCGDGCGYCGFGCSYGRKQSTTASFLADAVAGGATVIADAPVERVIVKRGRATGVVVRIGGSARTVRANVVVVAAGALRTPQVLGRSGIVNAHLGKHLHLHPTAALIAQFDHPIETWNGPMQSILSDHFGDLGEGYGVKLEAVPIHPGLAALAVPWRSRDDHAEVMRGVRNTAALIALVRDRGEGSVSTTDDATIRYRLDPHDAHHMRVGLARLAEMAAAAGATRMQTLHERPMRLDAPFSGAKRDAFIAEVEQCDLTPNRSGLYSAHQMGTARMSAHRNDGVVDARGRVWGVENLAICDSSVFPLSSGVNPMLTIQALAHRTATGLIA